MHHIRVVGIVSPDLSDIYFANRLIKETNVVGIIVERQRVSAPIRNRLMVLAQNAVSPFSLVEKLQRVLMQARYAKKAKNIAREGFGVEGRRLFPIKENQIIYTDGVQAINNPQYVKAIEELEPDIIALCGASIIKQPIIRIPPQGVLNLHGGLAQKYRGLWTTLWAIYNEEPEYVGYTVHYVTPGIDDGKVICQGRPEIHFDDNHETLYVKVVKSGTEAMIKAIHDIQHGSASSYPLKQQGKLYLSSMVTPEVIKKTWQKIRAGVVREYARHPKEVKLIGPIK